MTSKRRTRRALLNSVMSLIICFSMLLGTTFAWFTDSVTSANNIIKAGNLDVELYWSTNFTDWEKVDSTTNVFKEDALWEPGYTEVVYLKTANEGTLNLKYQLGVNVVSEKGSTNMADEPFKLSEHIHYGVTTVGAKYDSREAAVAALSSSNPLSQPYNTAKRALAPTVEETVALVVFMPETVKNEANHKTGVDAPEIKLGLNVFATQVEAESDSFGPDYDVEADTVATTVAEANEKMVAGKDVTLMNCSEPNSILVVPSNYEGTVTLNNVKIASVKESEAASVSTEDTDDAATKIIVIGNVEVKATEDGMSAITGKSLNITGNGTLTAIGKGQAAFGIGGVNTEEIVIEDITIAHVEGGYAGQIGSDTKYYKDAPEGGAAIGSGFNGANITLNNVTVEKALGGSKAAGIGARYHVGVNVTIKDSTIAYVEGGATAAGIGGSRVSGDATENGTTITIVDSEIVAKGGVYGAGIGSGYDTHCLSKQPLCTINIKGDSVINATGGQYAAGVGTGYHMAALAGEIESTVRVEAESGDAWYKDSYTMAQAIGFGVVDPAREGQQTGSKITYNGNDITIPGPANN